MPSEPKGRVMPSEPKGRAAVWTNERGREERAPERGGKTAGQSAPEASEAERASEPKGAVPSGLRSEGACDRATREEGA
jgi:hypothetical protein